MVDRERPTPDNGRTGPDIERLCAALRNCEASAEKAGHVTEAATMRLAETMLTSLAMPARRTPEENRAVWSRRRGLVSETCLYLTSLAADFDRQGKLADAQCLHQTVGALSLLVGRITKATADMPESEERS